MLAESCASSQVYPPNDSHLQQVSLPKISSKEFACYPFENSCSSSLVSPAWLQPRTCKKAACCVFPIFPTTKLHSCMAATFGWFLAQAVQRAALLRIREGNCSRSF